MPVLALTLSALLTLSLVLLLTPLTLSALHSLGLVGLPLSVLLFVLTTLSAGLP